ncbi:MAG: TlpA disulfide reductase family protein [Bacteroidales bacterium]
MKNSIIPGALILSFFFICSVPAADAQVYEHGYLVKVGEKAPDFLIREASGEEYMLSDLRGHVVMLQFTASWCGVCRREMPYIENDIWKKKKNEGLKVIGIDRDEPIETVKKFSDDMDITYPLALDPGAEIFSLFAEKNAGVTRNVIIDREGNIVFLTRLFEMDEFNEMKDLIFRELKKE